jgi:DNA-binding MarR family transcriptional regulator
MSGDAREQIDLLRRADAHIRALRNASMGLLSRSFSDAPVSATEAILMERLMRRSGLAQSELAVMLSVDPGLVSRMVGRLVKLGFVETRPDETDRRVRRVHLTEEGRDLFVKELGPRFDSFLADRLAAISPKRVKQLLATLEDIADALGVVVEDP